MNAAKWDQWMFYKSVYSTVVCIYWNFDHLVFLCTVFTENVTQEYYFTIQLQNKDRPFK